MDRNKSLVKNIFIFAIGNVGSKMLQFLLLPFYTRVLSSEQYGTVDILQSISTLLLPILSLTIFDAVFRFAMDGVTKKEDAFSVGMTTVSAGTVVLLLCGAILPSFFGYRSYIWLIILYTIAQMFRSVTSQYIRAIGQVKLFTVDNMRISYTADEAGFARLEQEAGALTGGLPEGDGTVYPFACGLGNRNEGFKTSSQVNYVARCGNFRFRGTDPASGETTGYAYTGALRILKLILSYDYLWQNIRVKGGAYGCMSNFNRAGEGYLVSYRDPNLEKTVEVYEGVVDYLKNFTVDDRDMNKFIIGTMSNLDRPMNPAAKGSRSMNLYMNHITEEMLRQERAQILDAGQEDIRRLADIVQAVLDAGLICVIGSEEKIEQQKQLFGEVRILA